MTHPEPGDVPAPRSGLRACWRWWVTLVFVAAVGAVYRGAVAGPFVLDDFASVTDNPTIRSLWPASVALSPPPVACR